MTTCSAVLKEWAVTCEALRQGRQIVLLRKGGILDEEGVFALQHKEFWLLPTYDHQDENLVQPPHRDLFAIVAAQRRADKNLTELSLLAQVVATWKLDENDGEKLQRAPHIWSAQHLQMRLHYKPEHPLLGVALRVFARCEPHQIPSRPEFSGCRSWLDLSQPLARDNLQLALSDEIFARQLDELQAALGAPDFCPIR